MDSMWSHGVHVEYMEECKAHLHPYDACVAWPLFGLLCRQCGWGCCGCGWVVVVFVRACVFGRVVVVVVVAMEWWLWDGCKIDDIHIPVMSRAMTIICHNSPKPDNLIKTVDNYTSSTDLENRAPSFY